MSYESDLATTALNRSIGVSARTYMFIWPAESRCCSDGVDVARSRERESRVVEVLIKGGERE
jgi:hypothetical protein